MSSVAQRTRSKNFQNLWADKLGKRKKENSNATIAVKRKGKGAGKNGEDLNPERKRISTTDSNGLDCDEERDDDIQLVSKVFVPLGNRSKRYRSGSEEDDERSHSDIQIVSEGRFSSRLKGDRRRYGGRIKKVESGSVQSLDGATAVGDTRIESRPKRHRSYDNKTNGGESGILGSGGVGMDEGDTKIEIQGSSSSEEEEVDSDDSYYEEESGSSTAQSDGSGYSSEGPIAGRKGNAIAEENLVIGKEYVRGSGDGFKKIRAHGLDIWVDLNNKDNEKQQRRSIRLRPRSVPESKKKNLEYGTYSRPLPVHEDENIDSTDEDGGYSEPVAKNSKKRYKKVRKLSKEKASVSKVLDTNDAINILKDSILGKGVESTDSPAPNEGETPTKRVLPLKFGFDDKDPAPPEKEEWEKEIDNLFAELEMCLAVCDDVDADTPSETENIDVPAQEKTPLERCQLGDHLKILEEPIGIVCKCCGLVCVEMKDIFPDLIEPPKKKREYFNLVSDPGYMFDEIYLDDSARRTYSASIQTEGSVLGLIPANSRQSMYRHQLDGFVFLWKNIAGETSIEKLKSAPLTEGGGCIISHAPGTGKTFLSIAFTMSFMKIFPTCRPVIVAPSSMLLTWKHEFEKWDFEFPFYNLNSPELSGKENEVGGVLDNLIKHVRKGQQHKRHIMRMAKLYSWKERPSVLGVSYHLFERLVNDESEKERNGDASKILLESPGLLVLDEGHTPRNERSRMWKALTKVETRRRIILSGTPFQNTLNELYNTLSLVNPKFTMSHLKRKDRSLTMLKAMIDPLVHVHKGTILQENLPGLKDMLVILRPTDQQKSLLQLISEAGCHLDKVHMVSLVSVHPSLVATKENFLHKSGLGLPESSNPNDPNAGVKTKFVMELVKLCDALNEKVLIFSEFIDPLNFIKNLLKDQFSWLEGKEVLYMDGKQDAKQRQSSINSLNAPASEVKVFLASTRACSEGINLVGASRVVLLDVVWNPSVERQAISRAYRLGQTKVVYVYHLIISGSLEVSKYRQQTEKHRLSELVFSCRGRENKGDKISAAVAEDKILEAMIDRKTLADMFEDIVHNPKESNLFENFNFL